MTQDGGTPELKVELIREQASRGASPLAWREWTLALLSEVDRLRAGGSEPTPEAIRAFMQAIRAVNVTDEDFNEDEARIGLRAALGRSVPAEPTPHDVLRDDEKLRLIEMHDWYSRPHSPDSPCIKYVEEIRFLLSLLVVRGAPPQGEPPHP